MQTVFKPQNDIGIKSKIPIGTAFNIKPENILSYEDGQAFVRKVSMMEHEQLMTVEESYVQRRQLFKDIWETAMHMDEKDGEILNKPKVIKTLRLSDVDRSAGRKKKQRIKNLRAVCKKILEFCDKQDADDIFYEQIAAEGHIAPIDKPGTTKRRKLKASKKVKRSNSLFTPQKPSADPRAIVSDQKDNFAVDSKNKPSRNTSPMKKYRPMIMKKPLLQKIGSIVPSAHKKPMKPVSPVKPSNVSSKKVVKKRSYPKRKKVSRNQMMPLKIDVID